MERQDGDAHGIGTLRFEVSDVEARARRYTRLGLKVLRHGRHRAVVELPCGIVVVLVRRLVLTTTPRTAERPCGTVPV